MAQEGSKLNENDTRPKRYRNPQAWEALAILRMVGLAIAEAIWSLMRWPFVNRREDVELFYVKTKENEQLLDGCPLLRTYTCSPWAIGPHAQTLFSIIKFGSNPVSRKEMVTMPDGVQITLLWFEPKDAAPDAPVVVSLHGIGGDENSVRPIMLAEECLRRGWRSVLYVRRGHGDSSLLPAGALDASNGAEAGAAAQAGGGDEGCKGKGDREREAGTQLMASGELTPRGPDLQPATSTVTSPSPSPAPHDPGAQAGGSPDVPIVAIAVDGPLPAAAGSPRVCDERSSGNIPGMPSLDSDNSYDGSGCFTRNLPRNITLPTLNLPSLPNLHNLLPGGAAAADPSAAAAAAAARDPEELRRTRKAFPQHADTEDFGAVLEHIRRERPQAPMVAVGFSMGSNVLVKYLGEMGAAPGGTPDLPYKNPLVAAVSVCNGYDIVEGTRHLVAHRPLADKIITLALHRLLRRKLPEVHAICAAHGVLVDFDEVLACNTIREFEAALMLPICGLENVDQYYQHNNCKEALQTVATPLLCLSSRDDPIIDSSLIRYAETAATANPHLLLAVTNRGGHLGWLSGWNCRSWMMDSVVQFIQSAVQVAEMAGSKTAPSGVPLAATATAGAVESKAAVTTAALPAAAAAPRVAAVAAAAASAASITVGGMTSPVAVVTAAAEKEPVEPTLVVASPGTRELKAGEPVPAGETEAGTKAEATASADALSPVVVSRGTASGGHHVVDVVACATVGPTAGGSDSGGAVNAAIAAAAAAVSAATASGGGGGFV